MFFASTCFSKYQGINSYMHGDISVTAKAGLDLGIGAVATVIGGVGGIIIYGDI